jgi:hypothetical protein
MDCPVLILDEQGHFTNVGLSSSCPRLPVSGLEKETFVFCVAELDRYVPKNWRWYSAASHFFLEGGGRVKLLLYPAEQECQHS